MDIINSFVSILSLFIMVLNNTPEISYIIDNDYVPSEDSYEYFNISLVNEYTLNLDNGVVVHKTYTIYPYSDSLVESEYLVDSVLRYFEYRNYSIIGYKIFPDKIIITAIYNGYFNVITVEIGNKFENIHIW